MRSYLVQATMMVSGLWLQLFHAYFLFYFVYYCFLNTSLVAADTPANCTYENAYGTWVLEIGDYQPNCSAKFNAREVMKLDLLFPDIAVDSFGNTGHWTLIYNQGFEVNIKHRKWLMMFAFKPNGESLCDESIPSWTHDSLIRQWKCFKATKLMSTPAAVYHPIYWGQSSVADQNMLYKPNIDLVNRINLFQSSWEAAIYPEFSKYTLSEMKRRAGGKKSINFRPRSQTTAHQSSRELLALVADLPLEFDWRKPADGTRSPVTPVRDQAFCGSCYAFASTAALEARLRLASNFSRQPVLSPQDVVDCSPYSEGCDGGFPYLVAGKYAEDFGFVEESCNPYVSVANKHCTTPKNCTRYYATDYKYIGGYYGATNMHLMQLELVHHGPFPVGFEVYDDFMSYKSGVYRHTGLKDELNRFNPFELTNHAVLLVGYGIDNHTGDPYWVVKNSWGTGWGEEGFFRILRGQDECGIESLAVSIDPIL